MMGTFFLLYDEHARMLKVAVDECPEGYVVLDSFNRYDDVIDAMNDIRALCVNGPSVKDVIAITYGQHHEAQARGDDQTKATLRNTFAASS
jgi:hypothetical protein